MEYAFISNKLTKRYKNQLAANNVDMHVKSGEIYGFVGENGAGKTTIIRLICGMINKTSGDFKLLDCDSKSSSLAKARKAIAAVVESPSLYMNFSAKTNMSLQLDLYGIKDKSLIDTLLNEVGLGNVINDKKPVKNFSLGMRQRLGIAIALVGNPKLIILDEPMNGLDPKGIIEVRELILKLNSEKGITFIISSHILDELQRVATTFGFISHGRLIKEISTADLQNQCKRCLEIRVANPQGFEDAISNLLGSKDYKINNNIAYLYDKDNLVEAINILANNGFVLLGVSFKMENIEHYYLSLMEGKNNE